MEMRNLIIKKSEEGQTKIDNFKMFPKGFDQGTFSRWLIGVETNIVRTFIIRNRLNIFAKIC